jgi:hypothetical protein
MAQLSVNIDLKGKFLVYPNPTNEYFYVSFPNGIEKAEIKLYNSIGQKISEKDLNSSNLISMENLTSGVYFYKIVSNSLIQSGKIIKN